MPRRRPISELPPPDPMASLGFLLSQVGSHTSSQFIEGIKPLGFKPAYAGILRVVRQHDGLSQQALGEKLGMFPSRLVGVIDEMEELGLLERRASPSDRRTHALYLTEAGSHALEEIRRVSSRIQEEICHSLSVAEREQLADLLRRIVVAEGLTPDVHPAMGKVGTEGG